MLQTGEAHTKRTLLHLSRAIESVHVAGEGPSTLAIVLFQQRRYFDQSRERFEAWTEEGGATVVAGFAGHPPYRSRGGLHTVTIHDDHELAAEWSIVASDGITAVSMVATEQPGQAGAPEDQRLFDTRLTFSPPHVADDIVRLTDEFASSLPAPLVARLRERIRRCARAPLADDAALLRPVLQLADTQVVASLRFGS